MVAHKIVPALKSFGSYVRQMRKAADMTLQEVADLVHVSRSYVGQVEAGDTRCRRDFAERLDKALEADGKIVRKWDNLLTDAGYPEYFLDFTHAEDAANLLRAWVADRVYGLFQTEAYARVLLITDQAVRNRMARQEIIDRENGPLICVIMDESVLHRQVGTREVMRAQIEHLIELSRHDRVHLQIAPTAYYRDVTSSFTIATQPDRSEVLYESKAIDGVVSTKASDLAKVGEAFLTLQARALNIEDSLAFMRKVLEEKWT
ncbi:helix-turn-helix domain-containing protein [Actinomadura atramentaria]|uniref:helix-turn-helix domain-containing protein n=1 Tax=Actinomadura atramentaria TaxID=1990 RepID=UPI00036C2498|nr:helix-turn-helix transcriptional regulator [Actinomadura atramentaria]